jgi:NADH dehydrogenase FAD-containing subunit
MAPELKVIYNSSDSTSASNLSVNGTSANQLTTSNLLQIPQQNQTVNNSLVSTTAADDIYAFGMVALEVRLYFLLISFSYLF